MHHSEEEKIALEHDAAKLFMRCYERNTGKPIRHIWHNDPMRPDVSCLFEGERLDIEIAHLYGSEEEAMEVLGRDLSEKTKQILAQLKEEPADERLLKSLNRILENKSSKRYKTERVWLVIRNTHPAWKQEDIKALEHLITMPEPHVFEKVWILGDIEGKSGIVRIYP
ncbi:MAG: hypothetical protein ABJN96_12665 [Marinomonas sp.]|uniref:hypothetical protein n=1 Tax=Marinomonas sp. GJ51-6 TaxID=2992802 RepID=UPI0029342699|nr:hypothetical protein [Marinomonas sp. GJ51-6]WOD06698.1 hypothetical protein ONZ50_13575 [Marinomonas sp. GJ51-6]